MKHLILLALLVLSFTGALAWTFFPDMATYRVAWTAVGFLMLSQLILFTALYAAIARRYAGEPMQMGIMVATILYVIFSIVMVLIAASLSGFSGLLLSHFFAIIMLVATVVGVRGVRTHSTQSAGSPNAEQATARQQSFLLDAALQRMHSLGNRNLLGKSMDELHLLSERLKMCRNAGDAESDANIKTKIDEICTIIDRASDSERIDQLPGQLTRRIVDLNVLVAHRELLCRTTHNLTSLSKPNY